MLGLSKIEVAFYNIKAELELLKATQNQYQDLFADIMEYRYPSDFLRSTPWGRWGDRKCDGYLQSKRIIYAVYAPNEMKDGTQAVTKVQDDYDGALFHWDIYYDEWCFVYKASPLGLGPHMIELLARLKSHNNGKKVSWMGEKQILAEVQLLSANALKSLFGSAPLDRDILAVDFVDISHALNYIELIKDTKQSPITLPPADKIHRNELSEHSEAFLRLGAKKSKQLEVYFENYHDPQYGDRVAYAFHTRYVELKESGLEPDVIFLRLLEFAGFSQPNSISQMSAILTIVAHLFEVCDIFESE